MAARTREVIWTEAARDALGEVLDEIAKESADGAVRVMVRALDTATSLKALANRGRVVPEIGDSALRELFVYDYRMLYRVDQHRVIIRAFLHGARDFSKWRREKEPDL